jgi:hypothetical protein
MTFAISFIIAITSGSKVPSGGDDIGIRGPVFHNNGSYREGVFWRGLVRFVFALTGLVATVGGPAPTGVPTQPSFSSNGCSVLPDGNAYGCCYVHDMAYWVGGTAADRRRADRALSGAFSTSCRVDAPAPHPAGNLATTPPRVAR